MVHDRAGRTSGCATPVACVASSHPHTNGVRRVQPLTRRRYTVALSPSQSSSSFTPLLRDLLCASATHLQFHLRNRTGHGADYRPCTLRPSLGRRSLVGGCVLFALLLDAASVDNARLGTTRRSARGV